MNFSIAQRDTFPLPSCKAEKERLLLISVYRKINEEIDKYSFYEDKGLCLYKLSENIGICSYKVSKAINAIGHTTFPSFINSYRNRKAKELLQDINFKYYTIDAIAEEVGFTNRVSFINSFKKQYEVTPHVLRKQHFSYSK